LSGSSGPSAVIKAKINRKISKDFGSSLKYYSSVKMNSGLNKKTAISK
jgi:hypothetical protein